MKTTIKKTFEIDAIKLDPPVLTQYRREKGGIGNET